MGSKSRNETVARLQRLSIAGEDIRQLLRISQTLSTWGEHECNGVLERDEETGKCYWVSDQGDDSGKRVRRRTSDRETPAVKRADDIARRYGMRSFYQTDPRGCAIYLYREADIPKDLGIDNVYASIGFAVCP
jgi:hypothetical protein